MGKYIKFQNPRKGESVPPSDAHVLALLALHTKPILPSGYLSRQTNFTN